jgi:phosphatidylserine/phosphatidylglycerophosphate/cardiolipin synthase-like enzyme
MAPSFIARRGWIRVAAVLGVAAALAGCAGMVPQAPRNPSTLLVAPPDSPLASIARDAGIPADTSGVWPLAQAAMALDARLLLIENATTSIDLQYYLIGDDATGHQILRALRDAARRGVRVRLLVDDLYTAGLDRLLLALGSYPNVEVRLFNPIVTPRDSALRRLLAMALDFKRLNHRMHNKLFIADGATAIIGGRNLADDYFFRGSQGNFIDLDLFLTGAVVPELGHWFDLYWNSEQVCAAVEVERASGMDVANIDWLQANFESTTRPDRPEPPLPPADLFAAPPLRQQLAQRRFNLLTTEAITYADAPTKIDPDNHSLAIADTVTHRFYNLLGDAHRSVLLVSPYFIPGEKAIERIGELRRAGVRVSVVTNSLAVSDEPLVNVRFERYQVRLLKMGVELAELSSTRLKLDDNLRQLLGNSTGRLHLKMGIIDDNMVLVGSMNIDPRSSSINTEIGVGVTSPTLAAMLQNKFLRIDETVGVYRVQLRPDGNGVRWTAMGTGNTPAEELDVDPDTSLSQRLRLLLLSVFVPESEL